MSEELTIATEAPEEAAVKVTLEDGAIVNLETGEVYGYEGAPFILPPLEDAARASMTKEEVLQAISERDAQRKAAVLWATERRAKAEAKKKGLEAEMGALIQGIQARFGALIKEQANKMAWIDSTYRQAMMEFTAEVTGGKAKSVKLPWATLGFRASKGALEVEDAPRAAWSLLQADEKLAKAVQVTISLGDILAPILADREAGEDGGGVQSALLEAIMEAFQPDYSGTAEEPKLEKVDLIPGVTVSILGAQVPDVLPAGAEGLKRAAPEHPMGGFNVKH